MGTSQDEATAIRKALAELEGRRAEVAALKDVIAAKDVQIKTLEDSISQQAALIQKWREAAESRGVANESDATIKASYEASVKKYEEELAQVRKDRDDARRHRWYFGVGGLLLGATLAILATKD